MEKFLCACLLLGLAAMTTALDCYSCSYTYYNDENIADTNNCASPGTSTFSQTCSTGYECAVHVVLSSSESMTLYRGCRDPAEYCKACTKQNRRNCGECCTSSNCNSGNLEGFLTDNALANRCHTCEYSEVPGVRQDTGCELSGFDAASTRVYSTLCPGLCYTAKTLIPGLNDVVRGCSYYGEVCDLEQAYDGNYRYPLGDFRGDSVKYEVKCCIGENCNSATAMSAGFAAIILSALIGLGLLHF